MLIKKSITRDQKLLTHLRAGVMLFYGQHQLPMSVLQPLAMRFGGQGFCRYLFSRRWSPSFWPRRHPAYGFLARGTYYGLYWPNWELWQEAVAFQPLLGAPSFGLSQGHFFLDIQGPRKAAVLAPAALCGSLHSSWAPLVETLSRLAVDLTLLLQKA